MSAGVEHWDEEAEGQLTESALRAKLQRCGYVVTRYVYSPGTYFPNHSHDVDKIDAVLSGQFLLRMAGHKCCRPVTAWRGSQGCGAQRRGDGE